MADTVTTTYIYPPNWDGNPLDSPQWNLNPMKLIMNLTNYSDGSGESAVRKLILADLKSNNNAAITRTSITKIEYQLQGMGVKLEWDRDPNRLIALLNAGSDGGVSGVLHGPFVDYADTDGGTGDIVLTTLEHAQYDSYNITLHIKLKE